MYQLFPPVPVLLDLQSEVAIGARVALDGDSVVDGPSRANVHVEKIVGRRRADADPAAAR